MPFMRPLLQKRIAKNVKKKISPAKKPFMFCCGWITNWKNAIQSMAVTFIALQRPGLSIFGRNSHAFLNIWQKTAAGAVWANYPFKYLHISLSGVFSITCGSLWRKAHLEETARKIYTFPPSPSPQSSYACVLDNS